MIRSNAHLFDKLAWWAWLVMLACVPVTSFPLIRATIGGETVSPLSLLPLLFLVIWMLRYFLRGGRLPAETSPLLLFGALAALSSALSLALPLEPYKGLTALSRILHGMATLGIGLAFYLSAVIFPAGPRRVRSSLRALYIGGALTLLWASLQATYVLRGVRTVPWAFNQIHRLFAVRDLFTNRVTGMAYEPSWLGDQLVVLYLPLWLASLVTGYSVVPKRGKVPALELGLAVWGIAVLLLAESRISVIGLLATLAVLGVWLAWRWAGDLVSRMPSRFRLGFPITSLLSRIGLLVLALMALVLLTRGVLAVSATTDWRIRRVLGLPEEIAALRAEHPYELVYAVADRAAFAERVVYWRAGFFAFEQYPLLGVGVGNAGFLFEEGLPTYGQRLVEIRRVLSPANLSFPNPKSLWIRLLAETGFVGTAAFLTWVMLLLAASVAQAKKPGYSPTSRLAGVAGILALPAWLLEGFSLDTLALPQTWILLGLVTASAWRWRASPESTGNGTYEGAVE